MTKRKYSGIVNTETLNPKKGNLDRKRMKKIRAEKNVVPPTAEEMKDYKEIENLQHSSLFRMQIKELLSEVKVSSTKRMKIKKCVQDFIEILQNLPQGEKYELNDQNWFQEIGISVPFVQKPASDKGMFYFSAPSSVNIIGSFALDVCLKLGLHVDLAVKIPQRSFSAKDYLNQRYVRKRALYLVAMAAHLKEKDCVEELNFTYHHGDPYKPILIVKLKGAADSCMVHIHPVTAAFQHNRFSHMKCNVRHSWFHSDTKSEDKQLATPHYNQSILKDLCVIENQNLLEEFLTADCGQLKDGIILLKVWLRQRSLNMGYGAISGFIMTMYVIYLLKQKRLNKLMSSYQVFRTTLYNIANGNWLKDGISFFTELQPGCNNNIPTLHSFKKDFDVAFVDSSGFLNFTAAVSSYTFLELQHEASITLDILHSQNRDCFHTIFIQKVPFSMRYDQIFHITDVDFPTRLSTKLEYSQKVLDHGGASVLAVMPDLVNYIHKIISKRITHFQMKPILTPQWPIDSNPPKDFLQCFTFGINLNEEDCYSIMEKGPAADHPDANAFRQLWAGKSELRKFKDGTVCEAVVWVDKPNLHKKRMIFQTIISSMLSKYFSISSDDIIFPATCVESILTLPKGTSPEEDYGTGEEANLKVNQTFDKLHKVLSSIKISVDIKDIQGISPVLRFSEVFPAIGCRDSSSTLFQNNIKLPDSKHNCPPYCPVVTVLCIAGTPGRELRDLTACYCQRSLYLLELLNSLQKFHLVAAYHKHYLDVLLDGIVFRLRICFNQEVELLKQPHPSVEGEKVHSDESLCLWAEMRVLPKLTSILRSIGQQHQTYGLVVRLAKRWLSAHFLLDYVPAIVVELLVASLFLDPHPFEVPKGSICGFLRFLNLVATFDWSTSPYFINLNNEHSAAEISQIKTDFKVRTSFPPMTICIPQDKEMVSFWTRKNPSQMMLNRFILIARQSLNALQEMLLQPSCDLKKIFRTSLEPFDMIIHLNPDQEACPDQAIDVPNKTKYSALLSNPALLPVIDFQPRQLFLNNLKESFGHLAMFHSDVYYSNVIAVLWRPNVFKPRDFKVSLVNGGCLLEELSKENQLVPNIEAIIEDMKILGNGIVQKIDLKTTPFLT
ncbi:nucleolar protein 6-like [Argonauta hians]